MKRRSARSCSYNTEYCINWGCCIQDFGLHYLDLSRRFTFLSTNWTNLVVNYLSRIIRNYTLNENCVLKKELFEILRFRNVLLKNYLVSELDSNAFIFSWYSNENSILLHWANQCLVHPCVRLSCRAEYLYRKGCPTYGVSKPLNNFLQSYIRFSVSLSMRFYF